LDQYFSKKFIKALTFYVNTDPYNLFWINISVQA